jgi:hypothetical protein
MSIVKTLSAKLPDGWVKTVSMSGRPSLSYVSIDKTILFLNQKFDDNWDAEVTDLREASGDRMGYVVTVKLTIREGKTTSVRYGVGADLDDRRQVNRPPDPDKLIKTAYANALKKATNLFGFALELWDESNAYTGKNEAAPEPTKNEPAPQQEDPPPPEPKSEPAPTSAPKEEAPPAAPNPQGLSPDSRTKIAGLLKESGLMRSELSQYLTEMKPASQGNPAFLTIGDEAKNVDEFVAFVTEKIKAN